MIIVINLGTSLQAHLFVLELEVFGDNTELSYRGSSAVELGECRHQQASLAEGRGRPEANFSGAFSLPSTISAFTVLESSELNSHCKHTFVKV